MILLYHPTSCAARSHDGLRTADSAQVSEKKQEEEIMRIQKFEGEGKPKYQKSGSDRGGAGVLFLRKTSLFT